MALTQVTSGLISSVSNTAISGLITSAQIASVANTQVTGLITSGQIATVANTQITGVMTASQIATVANTQVTGLITSAQIASVANTQVTGLMTASQIATVANTQVTGLITSGQIASVANTQITGILGTSNGGTNSTTTPTAGAVPYGTGTAYAFSAVGTSGQVLTSAGSSAPTWSTPSAGAVTLITNTAASGASSVSFTGLSTSYKYYYIEIDNVSCTTTYDQIFIRVSNNNGSSYATTNYNYAGNEYLSTASAYQTVRSNGVVSTINLICDYGYGLHYFGILNIFGAGSTTNMFIQSFTISPDYTSTNVCSLSLYSSNSSLTGVNAIQLYCGSSFTAGNFRLYGVS